VGLFGDTNIWSMVRRLGVGNQQVIHTVVFTSAGTGAPTVDTAKTRGPISVVRSGVGVFTITLPKYLKNAVALASIGVGGESLDVMADIAESSATCTVTTVANGTATATDGTGIKYYVLIMGTQR
jgi:hypothetical protein